MTIPVIGPALNFFGEGYETLANNRIITQSNIVITPDLIAHVKQLVQGDSRFTIWRMSCPHSIKPQGAFRQLCMTGWYTGMFGRKRCRRCYWKNIIENGSFTSAFLWYHQDLSFWMRLVLGEETRGHRFEPKMKRSSMNLKHASSPKPKKFKAEPRVRKAMSTIFYDDHEPLLSEILGYGATINSQVYCETLDTLNSKQ
ncbi:hypothetical protein PR048_000653 [Dryococelus australis]|uniref:Uncharacterized protein n=1 Tax=Dryococelus australis TaxID=614101 RepID=A0ABQ9IFU6_9NEOP|nr:hypothetical protein PR048_000653 [Dryococelus australis]